MNFIIDSLYYGNELYPAKSNYIEKYLFYRRQNDDIDADVSKVILSILKETNPFLASQNLIFSLQKRNNKSQKKYELISEINGTVYRGDTLFNAMELILQIVNQFSEQRITNTDYSLIRNSLNYIDSSSLSLLNEFVGLCYTPANFIVIPYINKGKSLNLAKGRLSEPGYKPGRENRYHDSEFYYLTFIMNYLSSGEMNSISKLWKCSSIWDAHYSGQPRLFAQENLLLPFLDSQLKPIRFWNPIKDYRHDIERLMRRIRPAFEKRNSDIQAINQLRFL